MSSDLYGGTVMSIAGVCLCALAIVRYWDAAISEDWVETRAEVVSATIESEPRVRSEHNYKLRIRYVFDLPQGRFEGDRFSMGNDALTASEARAMLDALRPGKAITVFRDPQAPNRSAMLRGTPKDRRGAVIMGWAGVGFLAFGAWLIRRASGSRHADRLL